MLEIFFEIYKKASVHFGVLGYVADDGGEMVEIGNVK